MDTGCGWRRLDAAQWSAAAAAHAARADELTAPYRSRRAAGTSHAIDDFRYDYYGTRPATLRRWHPGTGTELEPGPNGPALHAGYRWYRQDSGGRVGLDVSGFLADRAATVDHIARLLAATESRQPFTGCFGLHEWAMVYRERRHRHDLPLRLGQAGTDAVVEAATIRCTHFDAYRFFTPEAVTRNTVRPTRATSVDLEQPGCLHAAMDCYKWAAKLGPAVPGDLLLDCFALAGHIRLLDMQASPYDLSRYGEAPVPIETADGKATYVRRQRQLTGEAARLRSRLLDVVRLLQAQATDQR